MLEMVDKYICLGQLVTTSPIFELEIKWRISLGWNTFYMDSNIYLNVYQGHGHFFYIN